ncbi:TerD family protein [Corynebacterium mustelae]|nr:TerD family protein [Corynebacterium mustelae]
MFSSPALMCSGIVLTENPHAVSSEEHVCEMASWELWFLGFEVDSERLRCFTPHALAQLIGYAHTVSGVDKVWEPLFPDFPQCSSSELDRQVTMLRHYRSGGRWRPKNPQLSPVIPSRYRWRVHQRLHITTFTPALVQDLWSSPVALSARQREAAEDLALFVAASPAWDLGDIVENTHFRHGENFGHAAATLAVVSPHAFRRLLARTHTITDILRCILAFYCAQPDRARDLRCSREYPVNMRSIPREIRREILCAMAAADSQETRDRVLKDQYVWRRVLKKIHPFDLPESGAARPILDVIFGNVKHTSTNARVEQAFAQHDVKAAIELLGPTPGVFLRRLDHLVRLVTTETTPLLFTAVRRVAPHVSLTTLISVINGLRSREQVPKVIRLASRVFISHKPPHPVDKTLVAQVLHLLEQALDAQLALKPPPPTRLPDGGAFPVPLGSRWASTSSVPYYPGQPLKLDLRSEESIRLFVHWVGDDVDLGVVFADETLTHSLGYVDYTNLIGHSLETTVTHSGDVVYAPAPKGACEMIDIKLSRKLPPRVRYIIPSIISFNGVKLGQIPTLTGLMHTHQLQGHHFDPSEVTSSASITVESTSAVPFIIDVAAKQLVWLDSSLGTRKGEFSAGRSELVELVRAELQRIKTHISVHELLRRWVSVHDVDVEFGNPEIDYAQVVEPVFTGPQDPMAVAWAQRLIGISA